MVFRDSPHFLEWLLVSTIRKCHDVVPRSGVRPDRSLWARVGRRGSPRLDRRQSTMGDRPGRRALFGRDPCRAVAPHCPTDPSGRWMRPEARSVIAVGDSLSREVRFGVMAETGSSLCWMTPYQINHEEIMTTEGPGEDFLVLRHFFSAEEVRPGSDAWTRHRDRLAPVEAECPAARFNAGSRRGSRRPGHRASGPG